MNFETVERNVPRRKPTKTLNDKGWEITIREKTVPIEDQVLSRGPDVNIVILSAKDLHCSSCLKSVHTFRSHFKTATLGQNNTFFISNNLIS